MLPRTYLYALIAVAVLAIASFSLINEGGEELGVSTPIDSTFLDKTANIKVMAEDLNVKVAGGGQPSSIGFLDFIVNGAWEALLTLFTLPGLFQSMIESATMELGLGGYTWLISLIIYAFIISITFAVISAIFRRKT